MSTTPPPPAWLRSSTAPPLSQQQQQQQQALPQLVAHDSAWPTMAQQQRRQQPQPRGTAALDGRDNNEVTAASPTSVWSGTVSRSYESMRQLPPPPHQQHMQQQHTSPPPPPSHTNSPPARSVGGRSSRAAVTVSGHGRRVLRATPAPVLISSEEAVATRTTGGRWAAQRQQHTPPPQQQQQRRRYSTASSRHSSNASRQSRATTPPPPLQSLSAQPYARRPSSAAHTAAAAATAYNNNSSNNARRGGVAAAASWAGDAPRARLHYEQQQQQQAAYTHTMTPYSSRTARSAATMAYTPLTRQNLRAWEQGQLHVAEPPGSAAAAASPPLLFATEHARSPSPSQASQHAAAAASVRSGGGGSSHSSRRSSRRRGRNGDGAERATTAAPGSAASTALAPPSPAQQQQSTLPWWAQTELLHRGLTRPTSVTQASTLAATSNRTATTAPRAVTAAAGQQQQQPQPPLQLVSNDSIFAGKHRTVTRSNPLNIWNHESHILRNWLTHNNNNNTPPPMLFASAQSGGPAATAGTAAGAAGAPPRLVASEATTAVHTTRNNTMAPTAAAAVLTPSGSSRSTTTTTTTTLAAVDDKQPPAGGNGDDAGGGGGQGQPPPPPDDEQPQPPPPSAMRVRGRTFRTRNLNALHAFAWDRRIYLPAQDGLLAQPFRLFASPRFWEKIDWAVRGSLLCIVPMLILCLEPRTGGIFPLRSSAVALAFWINMPTLGGGLRELYIVLKGFSWSLVLLCIIIAWNPRATWLVLLLLFLAVFVTSFAVEQARRISTYTLVLLIMQYIYSREKTTYRFVVDYFVTLLLALAFGMVSFVVPYIRWASDIAHHYLGVLGDAVSLSVRGACAGFWVSNRLERQLHVTRLRQLRATITPCLARIATGMSEMGYEPHTGVYTAQMRTRLAFLRHISIVLESMTQVVEQIADDPALADTPLCNAFGERLSGEVLRIGAVMDATILRITDLTSLVTVQDMDDFGRAVARYQDALAAAREELILNNPDYHADHSDILLGFFFFCIEELCESIAAFHEAEVPPNNFVYFLTFPLRDINSLVVACITLRNAVWRRRTITRRLKEAIKLALCIVIAAIFQVYALGNNASPVAGVDIIALVYNRTGGMSFQYASNRLLGTVLGSLTGFLSVQIANGRRWVLYIFVALISFVGAYVQAAPGYYALGNAICNSVISIVTQYRDQGAALVRIQQNCFAILIYFIVSSLVWPMRGNTKVKMGLDISLRMFRETTYRLLRNLDMPEDASEVDRDAGELIAEMNKRIVVQVTNLPGALVEPTMDSAEFPEMSWRMLIASQQKLLATLMMMRSAYRTFMSSKIGSGADRTNLSVHWVVLHRISPYMTELSNLLFAAVEIYLWSLSKATIVPTAHLTTIHEGMLHCRRRIFRVYLETIQREVDGSVSDAVPGGGGDGGGDGYNKDASGSDVMHNWWEKARSAGAAAAAASLSSSAASVPHASPATSNNNNNDRVTATGVVVDNGSMRRTNAAAVTTTGAAAADNNNNNNAATTMHNASFDGGAGTLRAQRKTRQGAFLGYRLRPEEQQALRSYIETGTLLGTVAGISQSALNNASFVLEAPDYAANATAARGGAAVHNGSLATAAAHATTSANEPVANASGAAAALSPSTSHALGAARTPMAPTLSNASFLPPHPPRHGLGSSNNNHTLASAALPSMTASHAAAGAAATAPEVATAAQQQQQQQLQQNMTFVGGGGSGLGNASMLGTRLSNHSMLLAGVHAARRVDPVMGGGDLFTAARPNRAKQLAADAAAAAAAAASSSGSPAAAGSGGGVAAAAGSAAQQSAATAAATESTSAVAAAGAAADTALAIATDAAAAAAASSHAQKSNDNSNNNNNVTSAAAATTAAAAPGTPAPGVAAATSSNAHAPHTLAVSNATFAGLAATGGGGGAAPATPASAAAAVVAPIAAGSSGGLLNSSLALHNRVAQGNVDMLAATHHDAPHLPPLSPSASALPNHTFVGNNNNNDTAAAAAPPAATHGMMAIAVEHQSTSPPPPELHAAERASSADNAAAAAAAAATATSPHTDKTAAMAGHEPSVFAVPSRPPSRAPSRLPSRRPSALQRPGTTTSPPLPPSSSSAAAAAAAGASPHMSGSFAPVVSNRSVAAGSLLGRSHHGGGAAAAGVGNNSISGGGGGGALSGLLSSIKRMGNKPGTSRFALRDYEEDAEVDRDTYAIDHMEGGGGEHAGLRGTLSQQHGVTQSSPQLAAEAGHTSPAAAAGGGGGGVSNSSGLRRSFASALATLRRRGKGGSHDNEPAGEGGGGRAAGRRGSNSSAGGGSDSVDGGRPLPLSRATAAPRRTRDEVDDEDDAMTPEERDAVAAAGGGDGSGGYGDAMAAAARARDADEVLDEASNYDAEQGVFILTNRDVHSLEAFLFGIRTLIAQVEEFEQYMLQMIHSNEMAKKL